MHKLLFYFLVCLALGLTFARQDKGQSLVKRTGRSHFEQDPSRITRRLSKFCTDNTVAQTYLAKILLVIDELQGNTSYSSILKTQSVNFIAYLKDTANQALLRTDCEAFINGLKTARIADKAAERTQKKLTSTIRKRFKQVAHDLTKGKGFVELDN